MKRTQDKYGRGSAALNGVGFVDLEPGDTFYGHDARMPTNKDTDSERTPRGGTAPFQNLASQLANRIAYYVGDVKIGRNRHVLHLRNRFLSSVR